jgi:hypothetical protein
MVVVVGASALMDLLEGSPLVDGGVWQSLLMFVFGRDSCSRSVRASPAFCGASVQGPLGSVDVLLPW